MGLSLSHGTAICWLRDAAGTSLFFTHMFALAEMARSLDINPPRMLGEVSQLSQIKRFAKILFRNR